MYIKVGKICKPHGIKGEVKIISFDNSPQQLLSYSKLFIETDSGFNEILFLNPRIQGNCILASCSLISDRDSAENFRNVFLWIDKSELTPLDEGEYYYADLIGCECFIEEELLGKVVNVDNFGTSDLFEIALHNQLTRKNKPKTIYLPFLNKLINSIDIKNKKIIFNDQVQDYL